MSAARTALVLLLASTAFATGAGPAAAGHAAPAREVAAFDHDHAAWTKVLAARAKAGGFDYAGLVKDRAGLDDYLRSLERVTPEAFSSWSAKQRFAFWINVYNAWTVRRVVDGWPVKSIRELGDEKTSVWDRELIPLGKLAPDLRKDKLTLNDVENRILRPVFKDARVHAAIVCAARSCPPLMASAFTAESLDVQLDEQVKAWLNDNARNRFDKAGGKAELSKVFDWFAEDFQKESGSALAWIARFRPEDKDWLTAAKKPALTFLEYDWSLNQSPVR
jgi:membrane-bound lytic murein transglycosylase B